MAWSYICLDKYITARLDFTIFVLADIEEEAHVGRSASHQGKVRRDRQFRHQIVWEHTWLRSLRLRLRRSHHVQSLLRCRNRSVARRCGCGLSRVWQPDGADRSETR